MMSLFRKINIALGIVVCFFIIKPHFYSYDYMKPLLKECSLKYQLQNGRLFLESDNDEALYEWLYRLYPYVEDFVIEDKKGCIKGEFILKKKIRF